MSVFFEQRGGERRGKGSVSDGVGSGWGGGCKTKSTVPGMGHVPPVPLWLNLRGRKAEITEYASVKCFGYLFSTNKTK